MNETKIHWATHTWNPVTGCDKVSPGCDNCYAEKMSKRLAGRYGYPQEKPFSVTIHNDRLDEPRKLKKPQRIFVCSMSDLFHKDVPIDFHIKIFGIMASLPQHVFMVLTKRPENALDFCQQVGLIPSGLPSPACQTPSGEVWPENVWIGCTAEDQAMASKRIPFLLQIPAKIRFVSVEPMLGVVDLEFLALNEKHYFNALRYDGLFNVLDWVICGGESGPNARPMSDKWAKYLKDQCVKNNIPFFMKQMSGKTKAERENIPEHLFLRQFPK